LGWSIDRIVDICGFYSWQGPEIRTGELATGKPIKLVRDNEIWITTDYTHKGDEKMISMSYKKLAVDLEPGNTILCSDGSITLTVLECDVEGGRVKCRCENTAMLGEKKNVNLPGVVVDLPTITEKDVDDIMNWGVPNKIDFIAASFVRKGSDVLTIKKLLGPASKSINIISKVCKHFHGSPGCCVLCTSLAITELSKT
jgi:pyruvate kinase